MPIISTIGGATAKGFGFSSGSNPPVSFDYLVVAGGGSGGETIGGGGGAGGFRTSFPGGTKIELDAGGHTITVGAGGGPATPGVLSFSAAPVNPNYDYEDGTNSTFSNISSSGGGKGGTIGQVSAAQVDLAAGAVQIITQAVSLGLLEMLEAILRLKEMLVELETTQEETI